MFAIEFSAGAVDDLRQLRKYDHQRIISAVETQLAHEPDNESRNRKRLRPNPIADWELRVGEHRVFYDIDAAGQRVSIAAIGHKQGSRLIIRGKDHQL